MKPYEIQEGCAFIRGENYKRWRFVLFIEDGRAIYCTSYDEDAPHKSCSRLTFARWATREVTAKMTTASLERCVARLHYQVHRLERQLEELTAQVLRLEKRRTLSPGQRR